MRTVHEQSAAHLLDAMIEHPGASRTFIETRRRLKLPSSHPAAFGRDYIATLGQLACITPAQWPLEQVAAFTALHTKICAGEPPSPDRRCSHARRSQGRRATQGERAGARTPARPISCRRRPHPEWWRRRRNAEMGRAHSHGRCERSGLPWPLPLGPETAGADRAYSRGRLGPLEIGSTTPSKTLLHLLEAGAVARWPYGSDHICLLVLGRPTTAADHLRRRG